MVEQIAWLTSPPASAYSVRSSEDSSSCRDVEVYRDRGRSVAVCRSEAPACTGQCGPVAGELHAGDVLIQRQLHEGIDLQRLGERIAQPRGEEQVLRAA